jgi:two-component system, NarL family, nitrate/nitrite response regulator NarL
VASAKGSAFDRDVRPTVVTNTLYTCDRFTENARITLTPLDTADVTPQPRKKTHPMESARRIRVEVEDSQRPPTAKPPRVVPLKASLTPAPRTGEQIRILIADRDELFREEYRTLLETQADFAIAGIVGDGVEAVRLAFETQPDVLMLDYAVPAMSGLDVLRTLQRASLSVHTILLAGDLDKPALVEMLQLGARGFVARTTPGELVCKSIRKVNSGELWIGRDVMTEVVKALSAAAPAGETPKYSDFGLTRREREILTLVVEGETNKGVARRLSVGEDTIKHHLTSIFNKTGVSSRLELALFALHYRLVEPNKY